MMMLLLRVFVVVACLLLFLPAHRRKNHVAAAATTSRGDLKNPDVQNIRLTEDERMDEYNKRGYKWPLPRTIPNTTGWKDMMNERFAQIAELEGSLTRYNGYIQVIHSAFLVPNFTEHGFGLARCPDDLIDALRRGIREGLSSARDEPDCKAINPRPIFIDRPDLTHRVLHEMRPYAEAWSGMKLNPYRAYGFRLYKNDSELMMHIDKVQTHIISFILHIDSSEDAEPWPIMIEDFYGRTHEVILTPGDVLFYESSKCFHGRPRRFRGTWYSSIFSHYYPSEGWYEQNHELEAHFAVPPHWNTDHEGPNEHRKLEMHGTALREPDCPNGWCRSEETVKWSGPGEHGVWIAPNFERYPFHPKPDENPIQYDPHHDEL